MVYNAKSCPSELLLEKRSNLARYNRNRIINKDKQ